MNPLYALDLAEGNLALLLQLAGDGGHDMTSFLGLTAM
jgi:hypothetical protein